MYHLCPLYDFNDEHRLTYPSSLFHQNFDRTHCSIYYVLITNRDLRQGTSRPEPGDGGKRSRPDLYIEMDGGQTSTGGVDVPVNRKKRLGDGDTMTVWMT